MKAIMIATDFSESARHAAHYAVRLASPLGFQEVVLYHSYQLLPAGIPEGVALADDHLYESSLAELDVLEGDLKADLDASINFVKVANPAPVELGIHDLASRYEDVLVVIGISEKSGWEKLLIGSSTRSILNQCNYPILVVPQETAYVPIKKIVFACDFKRISETMPVEKIKAWVGSLDAELAVVSVDKPQQIFADQGNIRDQIDFYTLFEGLYQSVEYVSDKSVKEGVFRYAEKIGAQWVIAVAKKHSFLEKLVKESVTESLALHARVPLLVIH